MNPCQGDDLHVVCRHDAARFADILLTAFLTFIAFNLQYAEFGRGSMWKKNFLFRAHEAAPLAESENELFHDTEPALDSAGLNLEKFLSVWVQGEGEDEKPTLYTSIYVRTATLDFSKRAGFLQPLQGRTHQIKQMLTPGQKTFLRDWLSRQAPGAWAESDDHFRTLFDIE